VEIIKKSALAGRKVEIFIDRAEGSTLGELNKIVGKICGEIRDRDGNTYTVVESLREKETHCGSCPESREKAVYFLVAPKCLGDTLGCALETLDSRLPVGIARVLDTSILGLDILDYAQAEYSAIGYLRFVGRQGKT